MVASLRYFSGSGLRDWVLQRVTAVLIECYVLFLVGFFILHSHLDFAAWHQLFQCKWVQLWTLVSLGAIVVHAWLGLWTVMTDYIKPFGIRLCVKTGVALVLIGFFVWGVEILRSVNS